MAPRVTAAIKQFTPATIPPPLVGVTGVQSDPAPMPVPRVSPARTQHTSVPTTRAGAASVWQVPAPIPVSGGGSGEPIQQVPSCTGGSGELGQPPANPPLQPSLQQPLQPLLLSIAQALAHLLAQPPAQSSAQAPVQPGDFTPAGPVSVLAQGSGEPRQPAFLLGTARSCSSHLSPLEGLRSHSSHLLFLPEA